MRWRSRSSAAFELASFRTDAPPNPFRGGDRRRTGGGERDGGERLRGL